MPGQGAPGTSFIARLARQGVELGLRVESGFFNVSPFAVTAAPDVGDVFFMFFPSVEVPLESVTPDCD